MRLKAQAFWHLLYQMTLHDNFTPGFDIIHQFFLLAFITVLIWGLESLSNYGYDLLWRNLAQNMQHDLRLDA
jgi:hypothetical protein